MKALFDGFSRFKQLIAGGAQDESGNGIKINYSAASAHPSVEAVGDDTNVDLNLVPKGTGKFGYPTGFGGAVVQATSKATAAALNKQSGTVTLNGAALAADTTVSFTLTNTCVAANDIVHVQHDSVGTLGAYTFAATPAAGSVVIAVHNCTPGSLSEAIVLRFIVIKGAVA